MATLTEAGLTPDVLRRLQRLRLTTHSDHPGQTAGLRRSPRTGSSLEFADFRTYVPGDDMRRIDWHAYARLGRLLLKLYHGEEDIAVNIWTDLSASMQFGTPLKVDSARAIAAALAYVGLHSFDRVGVYGFGTDTPRRLALQRGRRSFQRVWDFLDEGEASGDTSFQHLGHGGDRLARGISVVISDFLSEDCFDGIRTICSLRQSVHLIQVIAPEELDPPWHGNLRFRDAESGGIVDVTTGRDVIEAYTAALTKHVAALRRVASECQATFIQVSSSDPVGTAIDALRGAEVLV